MASTVRSAGRSRSRRRRKRGTVYELDHIAEIGRIARASKLPLHLDGARFANALVALDCTPAEMTWKAGVDAVSFGGTKNGLLGVEAVIFFDPAHAWEFELRRKRGAHLFSKHRFLSAQMEAYLADDLWLDMARASNGAAARLVRRAQAAPRGPAPDRAACQHRLRRLAACRTSTAARGGRPVLPVVWRPRRAGCGTADGAARHRLVRCRRDRRPLSRHARTLTLEPAALQAIGGSGKLLQASRQMRVEIVEAVLTPEPLVTIGDVEGRAEDTARDRLLEVCRVGLGTREQPAVRQRRVEPARRAGDRGSPPRPRCRAPRPSRHGQANAPASRRRRHRRVLAAITA